MSWLFKLTCCNENSFSSSLFHSLNFSVKSSNPLKNQKPTHLISCQNFTAIAYQNQSIIVLNTNDDFKKIELIRNEEFEVAPQSNERYDLNNFKKINEIKRIYNLLFAYGQRFLIVACETSYKGESVFIWDLENLGDDKFNDHSTESAQKIYLSDFDKSSKYRNQRQKNSNGNTKKQV